ncbi:hypothetical protein QBC35DRAFT_240289, partial [Podospora australis]
MHASETPPMTMLPVCAVGANRLGSKMPDVRGWRSGQHLNPWRQQQQPPLSCNNRTHRDWRFVHPPLLAFSRCRTVIRVATRAELGGFSTMRLLKRNDTGDFGLTDDIPDDQVPPYAILSHTWGDGEVLFRDIMKGRYKSKAGYAKIRYCGDQAARDGLISSVSRSRVLTKLNTFPPGLDSLYQRMIDQVRRS